MSAWSSLAKQIAEKSGVALRPASEESLSALQRLGIPDDVIAFFNEFEPAECADIDGVRMWPAKEVLAENKDYVPGCYVVEYGYIVFATTLFGDAFCFDTKANSKTPPIVLIAHDGYDWDTVTPEGINKLKKWIAPDFRTFLQAYVNETLDIDPNYEPLA